MNPLYTENRCLDQAQLLRYVYDECSPEEARNMDGHLDSCPLCSAAVEGLMSQKKAEVEKTLANIEQFIQTQTNHTNKTSTMMTIKQIPQKRWIGWAAAASVATVATTLWLFNRPQTQESSANNLAILATTADSSVLSASSNAKNIDTSTIKNKLQDSLIQNVANAALDSNDTQNIATADIATNTNENTSIQPSAPPNTSVAAEKIATPEKAKEDLSLTIEKNQRAESDDVMGISLPPTPSEATKNIPTTRKQSTNTTPSVTNSSQKVRTKQVETDENIYEQGLSHYKNEQYSLAIERFNTLVSRKAWGDIYENALWYIGNSYLKQGDKNNAKHIFERIVREKSRYAKEAEKALRRL